MKVLLATLFAIGIASVPLARVAACSCAGLGGPEDFAESADAVFAGTVITAPGLISIGQTIYAFEVNGVAKGQVGHTIEVFAEGEDVSSCGVSFGLNERWLVFTTWDGAMHSTGLCSGNLILEKGAEAPLPLTAPTESSSGPGGLGFPSVILGLVGIVGVVAAVSWLAFRRGGRARPS